MNQADISTKIGKQKQPVQVMERRPMHDEGGTLSSLIRQRLSAIDKDSAETSMPTGELLLLLCSTLNLIEKGRLDSSQWQKKYFEEVVKARNTFKEQLAKKIEEN